MRMQLHFTGFKEKTETAIQKMKLTEKQRDKEFWGGYLQGLRRKHYGKKFRTTKEHIELMSGHKSGYADETVWERELRLTLIAGYKSGYAGETIWEAGLKLLYIDYQITK